MPLQACVVLLLSSNGKAPSAPPREQQLREGFGIEKDSFDL